MSPNKFTERRLSLGLSKKEVARRTMLARATVINAERGENITMKTYNALNDFYSALEDEDKKNDNHYDWAQSL